MSDTVYGGKPITDYSLWELGDFLNKMNKALEKRERAGKHIKFNEDVEVNNKKIPKMDFPPINPEFLKIKNAIELEIKKRQNV